MAIIACLPSEKTIMPQGNSNPKGPATMHLQPCHTKNEQPLLQLFALLLIIISNLLHLLGTGHVSIVSSLFNLRLQCVHLCGKRRLENSIALRTAPWEGGGHVPLKGPWPWIDRQPPCGWLPMGLKHASYGIFDSCGWSRKFQVLSFQG